MKTIGHCFLRSFLNKVGISDTPRTQDLSQCDWLGATYAGSAASRRVSSNLLEVARIIDHTTVRGSPKRSMSLGGPLVVAAKQEPAVAGETPSCYGEFGLELPYGDYCVRCYDSLSKESSHA